MSLGDGEENGVPGLSFERRLGLGLMQNSLVKVRTFEKMFRRASSSARAPIEPHSR
jgi:hypothetical protein